MCFLVLVILKCALIGIQEAALVELEIWSFGGHSFTLTVIIDFYSSVFLLCVSLISTSVLLFRASYMHSASGFRRFHLLVVAFIRSMLALIVSPNLITLMLGWDGLGISSFFLVIFYKSNKSFNAGLLTALSNRVGDGLILISLGLGRTYTSFCLPVLRQEVCPPTILFLMVLTVAGFTKRAQIPFSA